MKLKNKNLVEKVISLIKNYFLIHSTKTVCTSSAVQYLGKSCKRQGVDKLYIILSFDCDTPLDAIASEKMANDFIKYHIPAVFAVPGCVLEKNIETYKKIYELGFEFINHGYLDHAAFDDINRQYYSITWYHEMSKSEVCNDIRKGHDVVKKIIGCNPKGFRAPHFGYYQKPEQLELIYSEINDLNYEYASTTMPELGLKNGSVYSVSSGLYEFPVSGTFDDPMVILDSWQFFAAPDRIYTGEDYSLQFKRLVDCYINRKLPGVLNLYADPSHVVDNNLYYECIEYALHRGIEFTTYSKIIEKIKGN